ncbi:hypothetical protein [Kibdelosporangium aridum]|uniref:hypothetical protein n=1 Tax=Kibdelosporangium aridum TaxID=2030 RepID=UPI0035E735DA
MSVVFRPYFSYQIATCSTTLEKSVVLARLSGVRDRTGRRCGTPSNTAAFY